MNKFREDSKCVQVTKEFHVVGSWGLGATFREPSEHAKSKNIKENSGYEQQSWAVVA